MSRDREFQNGGSFVEYAEKDADLSVVFKVGQIQNVLWKPFISVKMF